MNKRKLLPRETKKMKLGIAIENMKLMHECCPQYQLRGMQQYNDKVSVGEDKQTENVERRAVNTK